MGVEPFVYELREKLSSDSRAIFFVGIMDCHYGKYPFNVHVDPTKMAAGWQPFWILDA